MSTSSISYILISWVLTLTVRIVTDLKNTDWRNMGYRDSTKRHQGVRLFFPVSMGREVKAVCTNIVSFSIYTGKALNFWSTLSFGNSTGSKTFRGQGIFSTAAGVEFSLKKKFRNLAINYHTNEHWLEIASLIWLPEPLGTSAMI